jgi:hypothetical protein
MQISKYVNSNGVSHDADKWGQHVIDRRAQIQ